MKNIFLLIIAAILLGGSCSKKEIKIDRDNLLIGTWNFSRYASDAVIYSRAAEFTNSTGYKFDADGSMTERNLAGWCGTPPVSYTDYSGSWTIVKENIVRIDRTNYDGQKTYTINFLFIGTDSLKLIPGN